MTKQPRYDLAKQLAEEFASTYEQSDTGIIPVEKICEDQGIEISEFDFNKKGFEDVSGIFLFDKRKIVVNRNDSPLRKRFTIAHEFGHSVLHSKENYAVLLRSEGLDGDAWYEKEANCFAASLLVPKWKLENFITIHKC